MAFTELEQLTKALKPEASWNEVTEEYFLKVGLPTAQRRLCGLVVDTGYWAAMAGNEFRGVHVTDKDGKVLFTTPPLSPKVTMTTGIDFYNQISSGSTLPKENILRRVLESDDAAIKYSNFTQELIQWLRIFKYYNHPLVLDQKETVVSDKVVEDSDYEEKWD